MTTNFKFQIACFEQVFWRKANFKYEIAGFTLIELLVVIGIIGMLSALLMPNFIGARERARDSKRKQDLFEVKNALRLYYNDFQKYPTASSGNILGCGSLGEGACSWGGQFSAGSGPTVYMRLLPLDSLNDTAHKYVYVKVSDDDFTIRAVLENKSDTNVEESQNRCEITGETETTNYYVCPD